MATAFDYTNHIGPFCMRSGISSSMLLYNHPIPELEHVNNGLILELFHFKESYNQCTNQDLYRWIKSLLGKKWPDCPPTYQAVTKSTERLLQRYRKLKKTPNCFEQREDMITEFLQNDYKLPLLGFHKGRVVHFTPVKSHNEKKKPSTDADTLLLKQKMYSTTRNANKRLKRREATISNQKECIEQQRQTIKEYEKKLERTESSVHKLRMKLNRVNHRASYWKGRFGDVKEQREEHTTSA